MDNQPPIQVKTPEFAPVFLPPWVCGNFEPKELAIILALQAYGAGADWVEITLFDLSRASRVTEGALPVFLSRFEKEGLISREKIYDDFNRIKAHNIKLNIWEWEPQA